MSGRLHYVKSVVLRQVDHAGGLVVQGCRDGSVQHPDQVHSRGKEPIVSVEEFNAPTEFIKEIVTSIFHHPKSIKDLCGTSVRKDDTRYYALYMSNLSQQDPDKEMRARWEKLKNSTKIWDDPMAAEEFERGLLHPQLARELYMLPSEVLLTRAIKEMVLIIS
ncbi:hypothetical protein BHE74_00058350 [Ensete ventricosum]|nr:hypothetical protein BHE74_00058350 [Ensete ventricosum]